MFDICRLSVGFCKSNLLFCKSNLGVILICFVSAWFSDPTDPVSPKDNPTRVPYSPKHSDNKDTYNPNEVLEKPGESTRYAAERLLKSVPSR